MAYEREEVKRKISYEETQKASLSHPLLVSVFAESSSIGGKEWSGEKNHNIPPPVFFPPGDCSL